MRKQAGECIMDKGLIELPAMRSETEAALAAVHEAMRIIDSREGADEITSKGGIDLVTAADVRSEDIIRARLRTAFPDFPVIGEERGGLSSGDTPYWLVDPICGTRPYASNVPLYCTNIALVEGGMVTLAAIGIGGTGEALYAELDGGAWLRTGSTDTRIHVSDSSHALWFDGKGELAANVVRRAILRNRWFIWQFSSSIAYPYVAAGRMAGLVHCSHHLSPVHTAAGCFMTEQAGAVITNLDGGPWRFDTPGYIVAATQELHSDLCDVVRQSRSE